MKYPSGNDHQKNDRQASPPLCGCSPWMLTRENLRRVAAVWIVVMVAISLQPFRPWPSGQAPSVLHRVAHIGNFGAIGLMLLALSDGRKQKWQAALFIVCLAFAIETSQHFLYRGVFEWWDIRDDVIGLLIALLLGRVTRVRSLLLCNG
jgi:hypothetical protein